AWTFLPLIRPLVDSAVLTAGQAHFLGAPLRTIPALRSMRVMRRLFRWRRRRISAALLASRSAAGASSRSPALLAARSAAGASSPPVPRPAPPPNPPPSPPPKSPPHVHHHQTRHQNSAGLSQYVMVSGPPLIPPGWRVIRRPGE